MKDEESGKWMDASYEIRVVSYEDTSYTLRVSVCTCLLVYLSTCLPRRHTMHTFADKPNIHDLHGSQICLGGDVFL